MILTGGSSEDKDRAQVKKGFSFRKSERILSPVDYAKVRKTGRRVHTRSLTLFIAPNKLGIKRIGLAVSSKVANSVGRNRVKRLIREVFRLDKAMFPEGCDVLISVKDAGRFESLATVVQEFSGAFKKTADVQKQG